ncbi:MAG TPA: deoxynucleoside kinase [Patescibacteria group bacterium]|jgi:thymidylate kinase|nr:deoxynucleoside kinase [Patescibacteria group bacterium]
MAKKPKAEPKAKQIFESLRLPRFSEPTKGPAIIAIEGPNGAGKTTLSWALSRKLGVPWCLGTDEAWAAENLKTRMIRDAEWFASAMFFLSGCFEQTRLLQQRSDRIIMMDRSFWSTLAVHGATEPEHLRAILEMLRPIEQSVVIPALTIVLEASFSTCQTRIARKTGVARALDELTATMEFHRNEAGFYHWLGGQSPSIVFLDANLEDPDKVAESALALAKTKVSALAEL